VPIIKDIKTAQEFLINQISMKQIIKAEKPPMALVVRA